MVFTNLIISSSYASLSRAQLRGWKNSVQAFKRDSQFFQLTTHSELPYSIMNASIASLSMEEKKGYKCPSKAAFPSRMTFHADTSDLGYFTCHTSPSCKEEACPQCPFLEYSYTPMLPRTHTQAEFPLGKKCGTCIFWIFMLPPARALAKLSQADTQLQRVPFLSGSPCS